MSRRSRRRLASRYASVLLLAGWICLPQAAWTQEAPAAEEPSSASPATEAPAGAEEDQAPGLDREGEIERVIQDSWWNHPTVVEVVVLRDEQRQQMDRRMREYLDALYTPEDAPLRRNPFRTALKRGDLDAASEALDARAEKLAQDAVVEGRMMIDILGVLSAEQRTLLGERFPKVFRARWLMTFGEPGRAGRSAGSRPRPRRRSVDGPGGMQ